MAVPHVFPALLDTNAAASVLLVGAGMSSGIAPSVEDLANDVNARHHEIVAKLGFDPSPPPTGFSDFYDWAERAFNGLRTQLHLGQDAAKVRLADSIGVTTDPRYRQNVETVGLRKHWARHRIAARFAREGRWRAIWSLNWDCILETALECVGLRVHPQPGTNPPSSLPWNQWYFTWSPGDASPPAGHNATVYLCKPHGCVRKIHSQNPLFIVTRSELQALTPQLRPAAEEMHVGLSHAPLVTAGWRADEDYICRNIEMLRDTGMLLGAGVDRLSIVNRTWYPKPPSSAQQNHQRLAAAFGVTRASCFFEVGTVGNPTIDELFQWAQTRYYLQLLRIYAQNGSWSGSVGEIAAIEAYFSEPRPAHIVNLFVDDFLSVWVRLCFNTRRVVYMRHGAPVPQAVVATDIRDEHIPWMYDHTTRNDMLSTIPLLLGIWRRVGQPGAAQWDFNEFPGAFWNGVDGHLILPLPAWDNTDEPIDLAGLKPLVESRNWERKGAIRRLSVLPLRSLPTDLHYSDDKLAMRGSVAMLMKSAVLADPANLAVSSLADI